MRSFRKGDRVTVYNQKLNGEPIIEGRGIIVGKGDVEHQYRVKFDRRAPGEGPNERFLRFVFRGECQDDPEAYLAKAKAEWLQRAEAG
jgi:hypothetical protein